MKKTFEQSGRLTLDRSTVVLLSSSWRKRHGANYANFDGHLSSIPPVCDVTTTSTGFN
jgi:hypothetical protein